MRLAFSVSALMVAAAAAPLLSQNTVITLLPGHPQTGRLAAHESQTYLVQAAKGQYLQARIEQDRLPLTVRWSAPGGPSVAEAHNYTLDHEPMVLSLVTTEDGAYSIQLKLQSTAATVSADYRIEVSASRPAREEDSDEIRGEAAYNEGQTLLSTPGAANARKSIAIFEQARTLWRKNSLKERRL